MAIYGWESPKQAALYTRTVNLHRFAAQAMHLLVPSVLPSHDSLGSETLPGKKPNQKAGLNGLAFPPPSFAKVSNKEDIGRLG
jgi:hypothetical protein